MNKIKLIEELSSKLNISKREASTAVETVFGIIKDCLQNDEEVNIGGFGAFKVKHRAARKGINPKTGERIDIDASKVPGFRPSKALKDLIKD